MATGALTISFGPRKQEGRRKKTLKSTHCFNMFFQSLHTTLLRTWSCGIAVLKGLVLCMLPE